MTPSESPNKNQLERGLTLAHTISLVVGTVIGTGVFLKAAVMAQTVGSPSLVLWAWAIAGLLSMAGALTYAELGALLPRAGGEYVYLLEAYGQGPAFLFGWMRFVMGSAGSIASLAVGFATFLAAILPINHLWFEYTYHAFGQTLVWRFGTQQVLAVSVIVLLSLLNCGRVVLGGQVQYLMTVLKVAGIAIIVGGIVFFSRVEAWRIWPGQLECGRGLAWRPLGQRCWRRYGLMRVGTRCQWLPAK